MPDDDRAFIHVDSGMPENPKIAGLSAQAFRMLIELWCWCSRQRTDGRIPSLIFHKSGRSAARRELIRYKLIEATNDGDFQVHDYLRHQRSAAQISEIRDTRRRVAELGNHERWHVQTGRVEPSCALCQPSQPDRKRDRKWDRKNDRKSIANRSPDTDTETEGLTEPDGSVSQERSTQVDLERPVRNARGARGPSAADAHRLVRRELSAGTYPAAVLTDLAIRCTELLAQFDEPTVTEALREWHTRTGIGPGVLPSVVADVVKRRTGITPAMRNAAHSQRTSTTDERVDQAWQLTRDEAHREGYDLPATYSEFLAQQRNETTVPPTLRTIEGGNR